MKNIFFILYFMIFGWNAYGQTVNRFYSNSWSKNKHEVYAKIGTTQFLGDLGGFNNIGTQKSLKDLNWSSTRYGMGVGYRFRFHENWATSSQLYFGMVSGDDANTDEIIRRSRNLSFRSPIVEVSQRIEYILVTSNKLGALYSFRGLKKGFRTNAEAIYIFSGISGFFFNPQTKINGNWVNLRPLKTEGQGLPNGVEPYSRFSVAIPFGFGMKFAVSEFWRIGFEVSYNKTFTDYIDDVSTNYYDPNVLEEVVGKEAVFAANPAIENHSWFSAGQQRGNPKDKDAYFFANITVAKNITYSRPKTIKRLKLGKKTRF